MHWKNFAICYGHNLLILEKSTMKQRGNTSFKLRVVYNAFCFMILIIITILNLNMFVAVHYFPDESILGI